MDEGREVEEEGGGEGGRSVNEKGKGRNKGK